MTGASSSVDDQGRLSVSINGVNLVTGDHWDAIRLTAAGGRSRRLRLRPEVRSFPQVKDHVIANFLGAVRGECRPAVPGREVLPSIAMIEECYGRRERFPMPWLDIVRETSDVAL